MISMDCWTSIRLSGTRAEIARHFGARDQGHIEGSSVSERTGGPLPFRPHSQIRSQAQLSNATTDLHRYYAATVVSRRVCAEMPMAAKRRRTSRIVSPLLMQVVLMQVAIGLKGVLIDVAGPAAVFADYPASGLFRFHR